MNFLLKDMYIGNRWYQITYHRTSMIKLRRYRIPMKLTSELRLCAASRGSAFPAWRQWWWAVHAADMLEGRLHSDTPDRTVKRKFINLIEKRIESILDWVYAGGCMASGRRVTVVTVVIVCLDKERSRVIPENQTASTKKCNVTIRINRACLTKSQIR